MRILLKSLSALCAVAILCLSAQTASANTAANTEIRNRARLTYSGGSAESTSIVTVALIPATPNVQIDRNDAIYTGVNTPTMINTVTITATANGPANYLVAASNIASTNTAALPAVQPGVTGSVIAPGTLIGATVTTGLSGTTWVNVPASGATGGAPASINGIAIGDTIIFNDGGGSKSRIVTGFTDNGDYTYRINYAVATAVTPAGTQVGEKIWVNLTASPGTITAYGADLTTTVQAVVSTGAAPFGGAPAPADITVDNSTLPNKWTSTALSITFEKYSRNVLNASGNPAGAGQLTYSINGNSHEYFRSGVTGKTGDTIEYVIQAANAAGGTDITGSVISDVLPVAYVSNPVGAVVDYGGFPIYYKDTASAVNNQTLVAGSLANFATPDLKINVGVGAVSGAAGGGTIAKGTGVTIGYQVTIK